MATEDDPQCLHELEEARLVVSSLLSTVTVPVREKYEPERESGFMDIEVPEVVEEFFERLAGWYPFQTRLNILQNLEELGRARAEYYVSGPRTTTWQETDRDPQYRRYMRDRRLTRYLDLHKGRTIKEIASDFSLSVSTVSADLRRLVKEGFVYTKGSGKTGDPRKYFTALGEGEPKL